MEEEQAIAVRELDPTTHLALNHNQLTSKRGILSLKSADRAERRNQQPQKEDEQRDHRVRDSFTTDEVFGTHRLTFTVVGPMEPELEALYEKHNRWLEDLEKERKSPSGALAAYVDPSVSNLSSIAALAKAADKQMLLTRDARGDKILQGLQQAGLLGADKKVG